MSGELFQEILDKLHELHEFFQKLNEPERWAFLYLVFSMVRGEDKRGLQNSGPFQGSDTEGESGEAKV